MAKKSFNKQQVLESTGFRIFIISIVIVIISIIMTLVSNHVEVTNTDEIKKAEVALVNDDLDLALLLYEEAYEISKTPELSQIIDEVSALIISKNSYIQAEKYDNEKKYESAYSYYTKVIEEDTMRYPHAHQRATELADQIVNQIIEEAKGYYNQHLYPMVIGRLTAALQYNVRTEEINEHLAKANAHFYEYYMNEAQTSFESYLDNEYLFDTFLSSLKYAETFAMTDEQKAELATRKEELVNKAITTYLEELNSNKEDGAAKKYAEMIIKLDPTNEEAKSYLDSLPTEE